MVNPFRNAIDLLQEFGFFEVVLPMLLVFAVFYAILMKTSMFKGVPSENGLNSLIAFVAAFFVVTSTPVVQTINKLLPSASLLLIISMLVLMLLAFWGFKTEDMFGQKAPKLMYIGAAILIFIFICMIDLATGVQIPVIHQITMAFVGRGAEAGIGAGLAISQETLNTIISLVLMLGIPILVLAIVIWKGGSKGP